MGEVAVVKIRFACGRFDRVVGAELLLRFADPAGQQLSRSFFVRARCPGDEPPRPSRTGPWSRRQAINWTACSLAYDRPPQPEARQPIAHVQRPRGAPPP
eukprot:3504562-Prymnesium_polylepis.1